MKKNYKIILIIAAIVVAFIGLGVFIAQNSQNKAISFEEQVDSAKLNNVKGTIYCSLKNKTINNATFYKEMKTKECKESMLSGTVLPLFWILWILLICGVVYGFGMINNKWLEG